MTLFPALPVLALIATTLALVTRAGNEVLFDSRGQDDFGQWRSVSVTGKTRNGWQSEQRPGPSSIWKACDIEVAGAENYLVSPFLQKVGDVSINIDIQFAVRSCDSFDGRVASCHENLKLGFVEVNSQNELDRLYPTSKRVNYTPLEEDSDLVLAGDPLSDDTTWNTISVWRGIREGLLSDSKLGLALVIEDNGACAQIASIKVWQIFCPRITMGLAQFDKSFPKSSRPRQAVYGECLPNAGLPGGGGGKPKWTCLSTGEWEGNGRWCSCEAGFQPSSPDITAPNVYCQECGPNSYKNRSGNEECRACPANSHSIRRAATSCQCDRGKFRLFEDPDQPCIGNPGKPENLRSELDTQTGSSVTLLWSRPLDDGSGGQYSPPIELSYQVDCLTCTQDQQRRLQYQPADPEDLASTYITVNGLDPDTHYTFRVYSHNQRRSTADVQFSDINLRTPPAMFVKNLLVSNMDGIVRVSWKKPSRDSKVQQYHVRATQLTTENGALLLNGQHVRTQKVPGNRTYTDFAGLPDGEFTFEVSTMGNEGPYCPPIRFIIAGNGQFLLQHKTQRIVLTIILLILVLLLFLSIFTIALCFYRKKQRWGYAASTAAGRYEAQPWWGPGLEQPPEYLLYAHNEGQHVKVPIGQRFTEPQLYDPPERMLAEFTRELDPVNVQLMTSSDGGCLPGTGEGQIRVLFYPDQSAAPIEAAAKVLKEHSSPEAARRFAIEAATMAQLNHPNVVMLHGVISMSETSPRMMVQELCEQGPLDLLLQAARDQISGPQIVHILRGVASAMHYVADEGYVHKVLRAHNVLISSSFMPKIAGFDERAKLEDELSLASWDSPLLEELAPWTAVESLNSRAFSPFSDVWSFGCLIWQAFSDGERPFGDLGSTEISKLIESEQWRGLPRPNKCPAPLHELACMCWRKESQRRPWFSEIREVFDNAVRANVSSFSHHLSPIHSKPGEMTYSFNPAEGLENPYMPIGALPVDDLLYQVQLEQYIDNFKIHGYYTLQEVWATGFSHNPSSGNTFLKQIGITSKKHRNTIVKHFTKHKDMLTVGGSEISPTRSFVNAV